MHGTVETSATNPPHPFLGCLGEVCYLFRATIGPGVALSYPAGYVPPNAVGDRVLAGRLVRRPVAELYLWRAGADLAGPPERVPAGTEVVLGAGDTSVIPHLPFATHGKDAQGEVRNPGDEPAVVVGFTFRSAAQPGVFPPAGMDFELLASAAGPELAGLAGRALRFRLERLAVAPGASFPDVRRGRLELYFAEAGDLTWEVTAASGTGTPTTSSFTTFEGGSLSTATLAGAERVGLRNAGDGEAVVLRLTVAPAEEGPAALGAGTPSP